jgi:hypothetical protein
LLGIIRADLIADSRSISAASSPVRPRWVVPAHSIAPAR